MKSLFFVTIAFLALSSTAISQACPNVKITSPEVPKPTATSLVSSTCSTLIVKWTGISGQNYLVQGIRKDPNTNIIDTVTGTGITCDGSQNCTATVAVFAGALVTWTVEAISVISGQTLNSYAARNVLDFPIRSCTNPGATFTGKVFLQGAYNSGTGLMSNGLNTSGVLQALATNQPYNITGFSYAGTENVGAGFFAAHPDVVDWVLVELRDANAPLTAVARRAAFVKRDGTLVETDGTTALISFPGIAAANYYVTIRHRNHLGVRTTFPVDFSAGTANYDFTKFLSNAYDGGGTPPNDQVVAMLLGPNVYGLYGGNANADRFTRKTGSASISDYSLFLSAVPTAPGPTNVYQKEDFNMDGNVRKTGSATANDYSKFLSILGSFNIITQPLF